MHARFQVWLHRRSATLHVVDVETMRAAGPLHENEALHALLLAPVLEPDGCSLGPWVHAFEHLLPRPRRLEVPAQEFDALEAAWLSPSATPYRWTDEERFDPAVEWIGEVPAELAQIAAARGVENAANLGRLARTWRGHRRDSPVVAGTIARGERFALIELPPPAA